MKKTNIPNDDSQEPRCPQCGETYSHGCNSDFCSETCEHAWHASHPGHPVEEVE